MQCHIMQLHNWELPLSYFSAISTSAVLTSTGTVGSLHVWTWYFQFAPMLPLCAFTIDSCWFWVWFGDWPFLCCVDKRSSPSYSTSCTNLTNTYQGIQSQNNSILPGSNRMVRSCGCCGSDWPSFCSETGGPQDYPTVDGLSSSRRNWQVFELHLDQAKRIIWKLLQQKRQEAWQQWTMGLHLRSMMGHCQPSWALLGFGF